MRYLWKMDIYFGRNGNLEGLFVATEEEVDKLIGSYLDFGEALGKHSQIEGFINDDDVEKVDLDSETVEKVSKILGDTWSGYNPMYYILHECISCGDHFHEEDFYIEEGICMECNNNP